MSEKRMSRCDKFGLIVIFISWVVFGMIFGNMKQNWLGGFCIALPFAMLLGVTFVSGYHSGYKEGTGKEL